LTKTYPTIGIKQPSFQAYYLLDSSQKFRYNIITWNIILMIIQIVIMFVSVLSLRCYVQTNTNVNDAGFIYQCPPFAQSCVKRSTLRKNLLTCSTFSTPYLSFFVKLSLSLSLRLFSTLLLHVCTYFFVLFLHPFFPHPPHI
jgi:hypothetical protein